jgi:peptide chain release factor 2
LEAEAGRPDLWEHPTQARELIARANEQRAVLKPFHEVADILEEVGLLLDLADAENDPPQREAAIREAETALTQAGRTFESLELQSLLNGELDAKNAFLTLHAGAGGTESCDWADMLLRMYARYAEDRGFAFEIMEYQPGDEAGVKRVTALVSGTYAYGYLKAERGVHRLVRISPFDSNKRRHTSFAALDVVAEIDEGIEVEIDDGDLRVDTYRSSGAGGQHVNTTDSAVRITHTPTGIVVACQAERSQHMNRAKAMNMLRAKLYELQIDEQRREMERFYGSKGEIAWGSQIRSYVLQPYTMVKDHRTGEETSSVDRVLDGALQPFVEAYLKQRITA